MLLGDFTVGFLWNDFLPSGCFGLNMCVLNIIFVVGLAADSSLLWWVCWGRLKM